MGRVAFKLSIALSIAASFACGETGRRSIAAFDASARTDTGGSTSIDATTSSTADAGQPDAMSGSDATTPMDGATLMDGATAMDGGVGDALPADGTTTADGSMPGDASLVDTGPGGTGQATLGTNSLDFGFTVIQGARVLTATITNNDTMPAVVQIGTFTGANAAEFTLDNATAGQPITVQPGASLSIEIRFAPTAQGPRSASLAINLCNNGCADTVTLAGDGIAEAITCTPTSINYGQVAPGQCDTETITCTNGASHSAVIATWALQTGASPALSIDSAQAAPIQLAAGQSHSIDVQYCPAGFTTDTGIALITTNNPNAALNTKLVAIQGTGGGVNIACTPATVDFGLVGVGTTATRAVNCANTGNLALLVTSAALGAGANGVTLATTVGGAPVSLPVSVNAGTSLDVTMTYSPVAAGPVMSTLTVTSNDPDSPMVAIPVIGAARAATGCALTVTPQQLSFGVVSPGSNATRDVTVANTGTGDCGISVAGITGAGAAGYSVLGMTTRIIGVGQTETVQVRFAPPAAAAYNAQLDLTTTDPMNTSVAITLSGTGANIDGIVIRPMTLDFGSVAIGCANTAVRSFSLQNVDTTPLVVTLVSIAAGSPAEFTMQTTPTSFTLAPGQLMPVMVGFAPTAVANYTGRVQLDIAGLPTLFVDLVGAGAATPTNTDTFPGQPATAPVDLLFVIDDSCSMSEEQLLLAQVAPILIDRGNRSGVDYHIGVTTTDPTAGIIGRLRGTPTFVDQNTPNAANSLSTAIMAGVNGSFDEQGLYAAAFAVTNATLLAGQNAGFLRANGDLAVIILSDEADHSPNPVGTYLGQMSGRTTGNPGSLLISTITGGTTGCSGTNGMAEAALRYVAASARTGGIDASICAASFDEVVRRTADLAFGALRESFQLGSQPAPGSIAVRVDGVLVPANTGMTANYYVDYESARVVFAPGRTPTRTANVEIDYTSFCVSATCGDMTPDPGEQCDDGNMVDTDACPSTCFNAFCGDGFVLTPGEQCDDSNTIPGDGCNSLCIVEGCGNGITEPGEQCDDGMNNSNTVADACRTSCVNPSCGDGVTDMGEQCDDNNTANNDACVGMCQTARCGDGFVQAGVEQCDDGNMNDMDMCSNACTWNLTTFTVTSTPSAFMPTAGGTPLAFSSNDDGFATVAIGFPFDFLGAAVPEVFVSTNGFITFENAGATTFTNSIIPNVSVPNAFIAWWWDDLNPFRAGATPMSDVRSQLVGTTPNRVRIITLLNIPGYLGGNDQLNVEIRLYETTNVIEVHYGQVGTGTGGARTFSATMGWESSAGVIGEDVLGCQPNCGIAAWPANTVYTYSP